MHNLFRILSILVGLMLLANGLRWVIDPAATAKGLGMELQTGLGASTQIGDISAFFICVAMMIALAQRPGGSQWFYPAILLLAGAAAMRTVAWATGHAPFGAQFIIPELVMAAILLQTARLRAENDCDPPSAQRVP